MEERTWIHAFTDGRDVSPTSAVSTSPSCRPNGRSRPWSGATTRWTATSAGSAPEGARRDHREGSTCGPARSVAACNRATTRVSRTSSSSRSSSRPPRLDADDAAIFFNFRPDRGRQLSARLVEAGVDLTTMTRYSDELDVPVAFGEQVVGGRSPRRSPRRGRGSSTSPRPRSTRTSPTSSTAATRRSGRGRRGSSSPARATCRATTTSRRCRRARSPSASAAEIGNGYRFAVVNFANPDMVGHTGSIPAVTAAVEVVGRVPRRRRRRTHARRRRLPRHGRPRQRGDDARAGRRQPAHGAHDESGAARRHLGELTLARRAASSPISRPPSLPCSGSDARPR